MFMLDQLRDRSREYDEKKEDFVFESQDFYWDDDMQLRTRQIPMGHTGPLKTELTQWALKQACLKHTVPFSYVDRCPDHLAATNLNWWRENTDRRFMLRVYDDHWVRAYLSNRYHPISNTWLLDTVIDMMEDVPYKMHRSSLSPDNMHVKVLVADTVGGNYAVGAYIGNGEIGDYKIRIHPMVMVTSCTNSIIFAKGFEAFHVNLVDSQLRVAIKAALGEAFKKSPEFVDEMMKAEEKRIPALARQVEDMCKKYNLSQEVHDDILIGTRGSETAMGLANGFSYAAQKIVDDRTRIDLEITAGRMITDPDAVYYNEPILISVPEE